ncbi:DNA polymerase alpha catalytic subunit [Sphaceloma murrayae]|uniref:DNA polymerase alpha catalytic subunit n=1 Tax=Sphaceloma murrayae TaxID=2082308 RepID=A0A2K1QXI7_9PEZI|nr:DNA polymerase alpha catalytic subunit [Sphaceloma murrayae]
MNDPGTDKSISEAAKSKNLNVQPGEDDFSKDQAKREKHRRDYRDPSLWWFASTGCPLIAGTFGPLANAFSVCALVRGWRVYIPDGQTESTGTRIPDPTWALAINALSLVAALAANGALLLNMSRRLRFKIAQPISVLGFFAAGLLLVADLSAFAASPTYHIPLDDPAAPANRHALTSAYYYGIQAAAVYLVITGLMTLTAWGAWRGHFESGFRLTMAQRTLMLQTMSFVIYLLLGALIYSRIEGWEFLDAVYWADLTLLTIGLGSDFAPKTHLGRSLLFVFAIGGIIIIGLVIGSIRTLVLDRGKRKISARIMEKKRLRAINSVNPKKQQIRVSRFATMHFDNDQLDVAKRRELEFYVMRKVQDHADRDRKWMALLLSTTAAFGLWLFGALVFSHAERPQQWSYFNAMYFTYVCLITVGYGDLYPQSNAGRAFFVFWTLLAVPTLTILISDMSDTVVAVFSDVTVWIGSLTVLPGDTGFKATFKLFLTQFTSGHFDVASFAKDTPPGLLGETANPTHNQSSPESGPSTLAEDIVARLTSHLEEEELAEASAAQDAGDTLDRDIHFYHLVLTREIRSLMRDLNSTPPKRYTWQEWEYYLRLMDNVPERQASDLPDGEKLDGEEDKHLVPKALRQTSTIAAFSKEREERRYSWLGEQSPLLSWRSETEWILERLGVTLERELVWRRKGKGGRPPVAMGDVKRGELRKRTFGEGRKMDDG